MKKLCFAALTALLTSSALADYPIFPLSGTYCWDLGGLCTGHHAFGNFIMGFAYNGATTTNATSDPSTICAGDHLPPSQIANGRVVYRNDATDGRIAELVDVNFPGTGYPGASIGIKTVGACHEPTGRAITDCVDGISYKYKGDNHWFLMEFPKTYCEGPSASEVIDEEDGFYDDFYNNKWGKRVEDLYSPVTEWTEVTIIYADLGNTNTWGRCFGTSSTHPYSVTLSWVDQIVWSVDEAMYGDDATGLNLAVKDITCLGGTSPVLNRANSLALTVVQQGFNLQISSASAGSLALFDMSGKQVLSSAVPAGESMVNLSSQKSGIYYAIVSSGSQKQTVRLVLK